VETCLKHATPGRNCFLRYFGVRVCARKSFRNFSVDGRTKNKNAPYARSHAIPRHNHNVPAHPHIASIKSPANQLSSLFCIDREMKYSPVLTNILPLSSRGSPESSNRSSLRGLIAIHAGKESLFRKRIARISIVTLRQLICRVSDPFDSVTLACTAAFAAGSVALLCMFIVSGQTNSGGRLFGLPPPSDWPQNSVEYDHRGTSNHFKATNVVKVYEATGASNQYGRRALRPNFPTVGGDSDHVDAVWPTGAVWLMVSRHSIGPGVLVVLSTDIAHYSCCICSPFRTQERATHCTPFGS
jgi:hypothetical protein